MHIISFLGDYAAKVRTTMGPNIGLQVSLDISDLIFISTASYKKIDQLSLYLRYICREYM